MKITNKTGHALIVVGDEAVIAAYRPDTAYGQAYEFEIPGRAEIETQDYEQRLDFYYHQSDDGGQFYSVVHVIAIADSPDKLPDPKSVALPSREEAMSIAEVIAPVVDGMIKGNIASSDVAFAKNIAQHIPAHFVYYKGNEKEAQKAAVNHVFKDWY
jgi:hypothetical protein